MHGPVVAGSAAGRIRWCAERHIRCRSGGIVEGSQGAVEHALAMALADDQTVVPFKVKRQQFAAPVALSIALFRRGLADLTKKLSLLRRGETGRAATAMRQAQLPDTTGLVRARPALDGSGAALEPERHLAATASGTDQQHCLQAVEVAGRLAAPQFLGHGVLQRRHGDRSDAMQLCLLSATDPRPFDICCVVGSERFIAGTVLAYP